MRAGSLTFVLGLGSAESAQDSGLSIAPCFEPHALFNAHRVGGRRTKVRRTGVQ